MESLEKNFGSLQHDSPDKKEDFGESIENKSELEQELTPHEERVKSVYEDFYEKVFPNRKIELIFSERRPLSSSFLTEVVISAETDDRLQHHLNRGEFNKLLKDRIANKNAKGEEKTNEVVDEFTLKVAACETRRDVLKERIRSLSEKDRERLKKVNREFDLGNISSEEYQDVLKSIGGVTYDVISKDDVLRAHYSRLAESFKNAKEEDVLEKCDAAMIGVLMDILSNRDLSREEFIAYIVRDGDGSMISAAFELLKKRDLGHYEKISDPTTGIHAFGENRIEINYSGQERLKKIYKDESMMIFREVEDVKIFGPKGEPFSLLSICPLGTRIAQQRGSYRGNYVLFPNSSAEHDDKELVFPEKIFSETYDPNINANRRENIFYFSGEDDYLTLLHEVGHLFQSKKEITDYGKIKNRHEKIVEKMENSGLPPKMNKRLVEESFRLLEYERNAWSHALRVYRELKQKGIDLFPTAENNEAIIRKVRECLSTYDVFYAGKYSYYKELKKRREDKVSGILSKLKAVIGIKPNLKKNSQEK